MPWAIARPARRIGQVLRNLLNNAVTHTPTNGTIHVSVTSNGAVVMLDIVDSGTGIPPEQLPHIWDRFFRGDRARTRATGGAGLGLAIVKQLVQAHGGSVGVTSAPGRGTTFTVCLPVAAPLRQGPW